METLNHIINGFGVALTPINLWYTFVGVLIGTIVGILPGIGPSASIALLIPVTYGMDPASGLIMMAGVYYGTKYATKWHARAARVRPWPSRPSDPLLRARSAWSP
jgi:putative tricarboxylic transport membrane protein